MASNLGESFLERNITKISLVVLIVGTVVAFSLAPLTHVFKPYVEYVLGSTSAGETGDAIGGISSPVIGIVGIFLTFLAFYIQYMANERQVQELEKQKSNLEYKDILERIGDIKTDIKDLTFTHENTKYNYTEAIWHFLHHAMDSDILEESDNSIIGPMFYQLSYVLTLFEPMMNEIERSNLDEKDKKAAFLQLDGLFESSLDLILQISSSAGFSNGKRFLKHSLKTQIIIPAKKLKFLLRKKVNRYSVSEKEQFQRVASEIKGKAFVRQARALQNKGTIHFYSTYEEYLSSTKDVGEDIATRNSYNNFTRHATAQKTFITETVKIMMNMDSLEHLDVNLQTEKRIYKASVDRRELEEFLSLDLEELKIDKELWRDEFLGRFVYDNRGKEAFIDLFINIKDKKTPEDQNMGEDAESRDPKDAPIS